MSSTTRPAPESRGKSGFRQTEGREHDGPEGEQAAADVERGLRRFGQGSVTGGIVYAMADRVILDCDGVLVDSEALSNGALAEVLSEHGVPYTREGCVRDFMGRSWRQVEERVGVIDGLREAYVERMLASFARSLQAVPGVETALDALGAAGVPVCVASSGEPEKMRFTLGHTGLLPRFEGRMFSSVEVARGKPAPDLFLHAAARMGWAPGDCAVVEDSPAGVAAGRAAGMWVLGFARETSAAQLRRAGADEVFADMAELPGRLAAG